MDEGFFRRARRFDPGILGVLQGKSPRYGGKGPVKAAFHADWNRFSESGITFGRNFRMAAPPPLPGAGLSRKTNAAWRKKSAARHIAIYQARPSVSRKMGLDKLCHLDYTETVDGQTCIRKEVRKMKNNRLEASVTSFASEAILRTAAAV